MKEIIKKINENKWSCDGQYPTFIRKADEFIVAVIVNDKQEIADAIVKKHNEALDIIIKEIEKEK